VATGLPGADSSQPVNTEVNGQNLVQLATGVFGQTPVFWGRYFTSAATTGSVEYSHSQENQTLAENNVRLLPIARQTAHVGGSQESGSADAALNAQDIFATFGGDYLVTQGTQFLMFLDVEGTPQSGSPSLSLDYFTGWAQGLASTSQSLSNGQITILPGVYGRQGDNTTWNNLVSAWGQGIQCAGAWVARYYYSGCSMTDWNNSIVMPSVALPFDVLLWQYQENCAEQTIDCNQTNPAVDIQSLLLSKLILPPSTS
jgi:hypothetical protein